MGEASAIVEIISNLGFPIAVAAALFWKMNKQDADHKEEVTKMTEALNNNTIAITKLVDELKGGDK